MIREHWREADFWRWLWRDRVRLEIKAVVAVAVLVAMLGGGWIAADRLSSASASVAAPGQLTFETTVEKVITVREQGKIVRKLVPVVKRVFLRPQTAFETLTDVRTDVVTSPGGVTTVERKVVKLVPVVTKKVITVNGKTKTVVTTRLMPTTNFETTTLTQTQVQTQVQVQVQTDTKTQTQTQTQTNVVTTEHTVTQPPVTQTETQTVNQTVTNTVTQDPVTVTVTPDPVTVTETVTTTAGP